MILEPPAPFEERGQLKAHSSMEAFPPHNLPMLLGTGLGHRQCFFEVALADFFAMGMAGGGGGPPVASVCGLTQLLMIWLDLGAWKPHGVGALWWQEGMWRRPEHRESPATSRP